jgi:ribonuclease P protein component
VTVADGGRILREERLCRAEEIRTLRQVGERVRGEYVTLYIAPSASYKFGVIASRRIGIAVLRNRARRVIREALRRLRPALRDDRAVRILLAARPPVVLAKSHDVQRELAQIFRAHGLFGERPPADALETRSSG